MVITGGTALGDKLLSNEREGPAVVRVPVLSIPDLVPAAEAVILPREGADLGDR